MPRWLRVLRGMLGMGLIFSAGVLAVASTIAGIAWVVSGGTLGRQVLIPVVGSALWSFPIGVAFSGLMALSARGRAFDKLSLPRFAAMGAGAGLLLYVVLAAMAWPAWSAQAAIVNAVLFMGLGGGSATVTLLLARRARPAITPGDEPRRLGEG
jgi:O-antigen/teichoic acid export membrane protein